MQNIIDFLFHFWFQKSTCSLQFLYMLQYCGLFAQFKHNGQKIPKRFQSSPLRLIWTHIRKWQHFKRYLIRVIVPAVSRIPHPGRLEHTHKHTHTDKKKKIHKWPKQWYQSLILHLSVVTHLPHETDPIHKYTQIECKPPPAEKTNDRNSNTRLHMRQTTVYRNQRGIIEHDPINPINHMC